MANRGVNKVILLGRLGADPDIRYLPNNGGKVVAVRFGDQRSLERYKKRQTRTYRMASSGFFQKTGRHRWRVFEER